MSNNGGVYTWSKTAANNAGADNTVNWAEGQAPSSINDSARNMMTSAAKYRDDISGSIVTTGTSAAYIVASNQNFDTAANFHGQVIAFTPHVTNAAGPVTMTVDGFANLPVRTAPNTELLAGVLIAGTPYTAMYNNTDGALYLHGFYGNPFSIPLGAGIDYWGGVAPSSNFALAQGQQISRTTYATLFALLGTTYGIGNGTTTFNIPDKVGRVSAMLDAGSARISAAFFGGNPANLGATGGLENHTLTTVQIAAHSHVNTLSDPGHIHGIKVGSVGGGVDHVTQGDFGTSSVAPGGVNGPVQTATTGISINNANAGGGGAHNNVQPTIVCNYIIRVL